MIGFKRFLSKQQDYIPFWLAFLVVIIISLVAYHPDFLYLSTLASRTASGNLNLYQAVMLKGYNAGSFTMPPLMGFLDSFVFFILKTLKIIYFNVGYGLNDRIPFIQLLLLKSRYILVFALSYPLVYKASLYFTKQDKATARRISNIWITCPVLLYLPFAQGNNDIYPAVMSLVFLLFAFRGDDLLAMVFLGLTAALKNYGVFLILPAAIILARKDIRKVVLFGFVAGLFYVLPSIIYSHGLTNFAVIPNSSGVSEGMFMLKTVIPSQIDYPIFILVYFLINIFLYFNDNEDELKENRNKVLTTYCFLVMSLFFVTYALPQWFLWIIPFFIFIIYDNRKLFSIYLIICSVFLLTLIPDWTYNLDATMWRQLSPRLFSRMDLFPVIKRSVTIMELGYSLFAALFIVLIYYLLKEKNASHDAPGDKAPYYNLFIIAGYMILMILFCLVAFHRLT